ncbi:MAG: polynucleotide kinase-phosphatase, partial [Cellulomonas sp.]|nr:polynucleotide kinase-phosphatase [Cellulomonas sp.]
TRTGRAFFPGTELVDRLRTAVAPLFEDLDTGWVVLDCELLPWSAKALGLIKDHFASVGAAARTALPVAADLLAAAATRGLDVAALSDRVARRTANADAYRDAYAAYVRPTDGLDGVTLAPFQVLAAEGQVLALTRSHRWHLEVIDRLAKSIGESTGDPILTRTRHRYVDLSDDAQKDEATRWWLDLTAAGGEGMVVKPVEPAKRRVQPGLKVRGREYLRIIYGPDYLDSLDVLRRRSLGRKKSLALREHGLGVEALTRLVDGQPLWSVHQMVFAVLALESEPVDPRL